MRKTRTARKAAEKTTSPKLGRTLLRPLGLAELEHVAGAAEVESDGIWADLQGDGSPY